MKCSIVSAALLVASVATFSSALPTHDHAQDSANGRLRLDNFGPKLQHRTYETGSYTMMPTFFTNSLNANPVDIAMEFAKTELGAATFVVKNSYTSDHNGVTHVYLRQLHNDLEVVNGDININIDRFGRIISFGDSFYKGKKHTLQAAEAAESRLKDMSYQNSILVGVSPSHLRDDLPFKDIPFSPSTLSNQIFVGSHSTRCQYYIKHIEPKGVWS
jgi:Zn-dependent metalloprotease